MANINCLTFTHCLFTVTFPLVFPETLWILGYVVHSPIKCRKAYECKIQTVLVWCNEYLKKILGLYTWNFYVNTLYIYSFDVFKFLDMAHFPNITDSWHHEGAQEASLILYTHSIVIFLNTKLGLYYTVLKKVQKLSVGQNLKGYKYI